MTGRHPGFPWFKSRSLCWTVPRLSGRVKNAEPKSAVRARAEKKTLEGCEAAIQRFGILVAEFIYGDLLDAKVVDDVLIGVDEEVDAVAFDGAAGVHRLTQEST